MIGGTSQRIHILKAARVGTTKAINRPKCHGHIGWKVMQKNCGKQRNEPDNDAPRRVPSKGMRRWKAERPMQS